MDHGPTAQKVAETGFLFSHNQLTEITLLHVIGDPSRYASTLYDPIMGFGGYNNLDLSGPGIINDLKNASLDFLEKTKLHLGDGTIKVLVKEGSVAESILEAAKELHASIIVMGSHSRRWLENILLGSITEYVLHHTSVPLFIVPTKKHISTVLYSDLSTLSHIN